MLKINKINDLSEVKNTTIQKRAERVVSGRSQEYIVMFDGAESAFFSFEDWSDTEKMEKYLSTRHA